MTASPIRADSGAIVQVVEIAQDVTDRKRADETKSKLEAQLQQFSSQRQKSCFIIIFADGQQSVLLGLLSLPHLQ